MLIWDVGRSPAVVLLQREGAITNGRTFCRSASTRQQEARMCRALGVVQRTYNHLVGPVVVFISVVSA
jgi:hypothetical protein